MRTVKQEFRDFRHNVGPCQKYWLMFSWTLVFSLLAVAVAENLGIFKWMDVQTAWLLENIHTIQQ